MSLKQTTTHSGIDLARKCAQILPKEKLNFKTLDHRSGSNSGFSRCFPTQVKKSIIYSRNWVGLILRRQTYYVFTRARQSWIGRERETNHW
jgi:hypothetical protein